jgi:chaperonin GroES
MKIHSLLVLFSAAASVADAWIPSSGAFATTTTTTATATATTTTATTSTVLHSSAAPVTLDGNEIRGDITPLGNLVLVKVKDTLTATGGGILLPDQSKERPTEGLVLEAGPGKLHPVTGVRITNPIKKGMSVLYGKFDGRPVEYKGDECQMIHDDDCLLYYQGVTMNLGNVVPVRDYVLVALDKNAEKLETASGVVIASSVMGDQRPCQGMVVKVGEGRLASRGELTKSPVQSGEMVKFKDYAGNEVMIEGKLHSVVKMVDILCTFNAEEKVE